MLRNLTVLTGRLDEAVPSCGFVNGWELSLKTSTSGSRFPSIRASDTKCSNCFDA